MLVAKKRGPFMNIVFRVQLRRILQQREAQERNGKGFLALLLIKTNIYMVHPWNSKLEQDGMHFFAEVFRSGWNALEAERSGGGGRIGSYRIE